MAEKEASRLNTPLWSISRIRNLLRSFFRGQNYQFFSSRNILRQRGLTLIELLTVIAILSVLMVALLAAVDPVTQLEKGRDTQRKSDLAQIQKGLEQYYDDHNGQYPTSNSSYQIVNGNTAAPWGTTSFAPYLSLLPKDPKSGFNYVYVQGTNGQSYYLYASLERGSNDPNVCNNGNRCVNAPADASCTGQVHCCGNGICNYGVSSPNVSP